MTTLTTEQERLNRHVAQAIAWGYQTGGDLDEALRLMWELDRVLVDDPAEIRVIGQAFEREFES